MRAHSNHQLAHPCICTAQERKKLAEASFKGLNFWEKFRRRLASEVPAACRLKLVRVEPNSGKHADSLIGWGHFFFPAEVDPPNVWVQRREDAAGAIDLLINFCGSTPPHAESVVPHGRKLVDVEAR